MFGFVDENTIKISIALIILFVVAFIFPGSLKKYIPLSIFVFVSIIAILIYARESSISDNTKYFKNGDNLICQAKDENLYLVSKEKGWSIKDIYFLKDSLLIEANHCDKKDSI